MSKAEAWDFVHAIEGGWYDGSLPSDSNPTMWGITQNTYSRYLVKMGRPNRTVDRITRPEADAIYEDFWQRSRADELPYPVSALHFAYAINAGPSGEPQAAIEVLQRVLRVADDGVIGPKSRAAISIASTRVPLLYYDLFVAHLTEYRRMIKQPRLAPNARSWMMRLIEAHKRHRLTLFA